MTLNPDKVDYWIFDLDNTLYSAEIDLFSQVDKRMGEFISQRLHLSWTAAKSLQKTYFKTYGTTLRGLMTEHDIPAQEYLDYVHDINLDVLVENKPLTHVLKKLKGTKLVYTNASKDYALKVMAKIGLKDIFEDIFDIHSANFLPKPHPESYDKMVRDLDVDPDRAVMVEDIARNLVPASKLGMKTVWVPTGDHWSGECRQQDHIDYTAPNLTEWLVGLVK